MPTSMGFASGPRAGPVAPNPCPDGGLGSGTVRVSVAVFAHGRPVPTGPSPRSDSSDVLANGRFSTVNGFFSKNFKIKLQVTHTSNKLLGSQGALFPSY